MAVEIGSAYFTLIPSMAGTAAAVRTGLGSAAVASAFTGGGTLGGAAFMAGMGGAVKKLLPGIGIASIGIGISNFINDSIDAASNLNESGNAIRVTFGDAAAAIEKLGTTSASRLGLSQNDFNAAATRFSAFAYSLEGTGRTVSDVIDEITTRSADFASVYNIDVADAMAIFQSGLAGEAEPLKRFGINLLDSQVSAYAYANGIAEVGVRLTEAQKIQARYGLLLQETSKTQGDFANTSDQLANQQRINAARMEDALAKIGTALLPAVTAFAEWVGNEKNQELLGKLVDLFIKLEPAISATADAFIWFADNFSFPLNALATLLDMVDDGSTAVDKFNNLMSIVPDNVKDAIFGFGAFVQTMMNATIGFFNAIIGGAEGTVNALRSLLGMSGTITLPRLPTAGNPFGGVFGLDGGLGSLTSAQRNALGFPGMAGGGSVGSAGWSWVGERGPELAYMPSGAQVIPSDVAGQGLELGPKTLRTLDRIMAERMALYLDGQDVARSVGNSNTRSTALGAA